MLHGSPHDFIISLESQRWRVNQVKENGARLASAYGTFKSTGWGEFCRPQVLMFGCTFVSRPTFSYGYSLDEGVDLVDTRFPRAWCFPHGWWIDKRGNYTGAYLSFVVDTQSPYITTALQDPNYTIVHDVTFQGVAMKQLPSWLLEDG